MDRFKKKLYTWLRWSERYTKTDMVYLAKGGGWLTGGQILSSAATFLLAVAFANLLPQETYGTYKFVLSIVAILSIPTLSGMSTAVARAVARGDEGTVRPALTTKLRWGSLASLASIGTAGYYFVNGNAELTISFLIAAVFLPLMDAFNLYDSYLQGKKDFGKVSRYNLYIKVGSVATLIAAIFFTSNLFIILLAYFVPYTILRYIFLQVTLKKLPPNNKKDGSAIGYGKHLTVMGVIGIISSQLDKILLFHFLGAAPVAIYTIAIAPVEQIKGVLKNINTLGLPKFAEQDWTKLRRNIIKKTAKFAVLVSVIITIYILIAPPIFQLVFPTYPESIHFSQIFALSLIGALAALPYTALRAHKKTKKLYAYNTYSPIFYILLLVPAVIYWGLLGAIIAWVAGRIFNIGLAFFLARE